MGVDPCTYANKNLVRPSSIFTSKISVLLGVSCTNFEIFEVDQYLKPLPPFCTLKRNTCDESVLQVGGIRTKKEWRNGRVAVDTGVRPKKTTKP